MKIDFRVPHVMVLMTFLLVTNMLNASDHSIREFFGQKIGSFATDEEIDSSQLPRNLAEPFLMMDKYVIKYTNTRRLYLVELISPDIRVDRTKSGEMRMRICNELVSRYRGNLKIEDFPGGKQIRFIDHEDTPQRIEVHAFQWSDGLRFTVRLIDETLASGKCPSWLDQKVKDPCLQGKTNPIKGIFGVSLGSDISNMSVPCDKMKKSVFGCNYTFSPRKTFRRFDKYYLKVENGKISSIIAAWKLPRDGHGVDDEKKAIRAILKEKYKIQFLTHNEMTHVGNGDDYTFLSVYTRARSSYMPVGYLLIELCEDTKRRDYDIYKRSQEIRKSEQAENEKKAKLWGIDAL